MGGQGEWCRCWCEHGKRRDQVGEGERERVILKSGASGASLRQGRI